MSFDSLFVKKKKNGGHDTRPRLYLNFSFFARTPFSSLYHDQYFQKHQTTSIFLFLLIFFNIWVSEID